LKATSPSFAKIDISFRMNNLPMENVHTEKLLFDFMGNTTIFAQTFYSEGLVYIIIISTLPVCEDREDFYYRYFHQANLRLLSR
jgi:hypothetical protein